MSASKPRPARADKAEEPVETPSPAAPEPAEPEVAEAPAEPEAPEQPSEDVAEAAQVETPEPVAEPAPAVEVAGYAEILEQAIKQRNRKKKQELLRQAIEVNPSGDEALAILAMLLMERGKTRSEALELATRAVEANPDNGLGWLVIGYVKQVVGKAAEAKDAYRKCASCSGPKKYVRECRLLG